MKECKFIRQNDYDCIVYECSNCKEEWCYEDGTPADNSYNYCPKCGAKITEVIELEEEQMEEIKNEYKMPELENMKNLFDDLYENWKDLIDKLNEVK